MKEPNTYGEFTVFFEFLNKFTKEDLTNLELIESTFEKHLTEIQQYQAQLEDFKKFMNLDTLQNNKQIYFRTKLISLAQTVNDSLFLG